MDALQVLIQGGAVGLAILALGVLYKVVTTYTHQSISVIKENAESSRILAEQLGIHSEVIRSLRETMERRR